MANASDEKENSKPQDAFGYAAFYKIHTQDLIKNSARFVVDAARAFNEQAKKLKEKLFFIDQPPTPDPS
ncbi:MAG: hypothetical protein H6868_03640 [Rhodospirillales bacterium]|nr:hypothetical protein [Rhodospirillales bacterium]